MEKQYKLVSLTTGSEKICSKVTIEGFDYYLTDEQIKDVRYFTGCWQVEEGSILNQLPDYLTDLSECKLVIATTNPNIGAGQVITIGESMLGDPQDILSNDIGTKEGFATGFIIGCNMMFDEKPFSGKEIEEFLLWKDENRWFNFTDDKWNYTFEQGTSISEKTYNKNYRKTTLELIDIWLSQRTETIYFKQK